MRRGDNLQGALDLLVLKSLQRSANHGFGIALHVQDASEGLLRMEEGSLYPALHRLERERLIHGEWRSTENRRRARFYKLTAAGKRRLAQVESNWSSVSLGIQKVLRSV
jgi:PadR family transcriptional regulator PadR